MTTEQLILKSSRVVTSQGVFPGYVHVEGQRIRAVGAGAAPSGVPVEDVGDAVVMAGLVDTHVHINEPGRTDWEGFATATRAAAAGGVTTLVEMPLNAIPATNDAGALTTKVAAAHGKCRVDVGFWGGVVPGNAGELEALYEAGVWGFKAFMSPSGVDEFDHVGLDDLREAMPVLARLGAPLLVHAEWPPALEPGAWDGADVRDHGAWLASRPPQAEREAIAHLIALSRQTGARVHIVHVADQGALGLLAEARAEGLPVSAETCAHYLTFCAEEIPAGATQYKCAPPLRNRDNREGLWAGLRDGTLAMITTDHSPSPPEVKCLDSGDFLRAWGGIASLQLLLPAVWTQARARGFELPALARWLCEEPAALAGLHRKGRLAPGMDADLVVWDPEATFNVEAAALHHRHKVTPYDGMTLAGVVRATWVRGQKIDINRDSGAEGAVLLRGDDGRQEA